MIKRQMLMAVVALLPVAIFSQQALSASDFIGRLYRGSLYVRGECSASMRPDRFYIDGGVAGEGTKTTEAKKILLTKISGLRRLAAKYGGRLEKKEIVRTIRNAGGYGKGAPGSQIKPSYLIVQRFRLDFPAKADIDSVLEGVMNLKVDYLGSNFRIGYRNSRPQVLAHYRFSNLKKRLDNVLKRCRNEAYKGWCTTKAGPGQQQQCLKAIKAMDGDFITRSFYLKSQPVLNARGRSRPISIRYPWNQSRLDRFVLLGDVKVELSGRISLYRNRRY